MYAPSLLIREEPQFLILPDSYIVAQWWRVECKKKIEELVANAKTTFLRLEEQELDLGAFSKVTRSSSSATERTL